MLSFVWNIINDRFKFIMSGFLCLLIVIFVYAEPLFYTPHLLFQIIDYLNSLFVCEQIANVKSSNKKKFYTTTQKSRLILYREYVFFDQAIRPFRDAIERQLLVLANARHIISSVYGDFRSSSTSLQPHTKPHRN